VNTYLQYLARFRTPIKDEEAVQQFRLSFEQYVRETDAPAIADDSSYWLSIIGDRMGAF
jgi:hypothetical protein